MGLILSNEDAKYVLEQLKIREWEYQGPLNDWYECPECYVKSVDYRRNGEWIFEEGTHKEDCKLHKIIVHIKNNLHT